MPGTLTQAKMVGFYGKVPARGDFVRSGLPRDFIEAWDSWLSEVMSISKEIGGDAWLPAFLEAPVWRFALPPGLCGASAVVGLMLPSVDKAGRYFPLTFAAAHDSPGLPFGSAVDAWLDCCEDAGRAALEQDLEPDEIKAMLSLPDLPSSDTPADETKWWTEGSRRLGPTRRTLQGLPDAASFLEMIGIVTQTG
jgi:type VI secretion system protein ImpM